jgi:transposase
MANQSEVSDAEWSFVAPYVCLLLEDAMQRRHDRRAVFHAWKGWVWTGAPWHALPHDFPPWSVVY